MAKLENKNEQVHLARGAGAWYLIYLVLGALGALLAGKHILKDGGGVENSIRFGIIATIASYICFLIVSMKLARLFRSTNHALAGLLLAFGVIGVVIALIGSTFAGFNVTIISTLFFGLWLLPLAVLVHRSGLFPGFIVFLLTLAMICQIAIFLTAYIFKGWYDAVYAVGSAIAGISMFIYALYLTIKGTKHETRAIR